MKKLIALALAVVMVLSLAACSVQTVEETKAAAPAATEAAAPAATEAAVPAAPEAAKEITLWTFPIGKWGDQAVVDELMAQFKAETGISGKVEFLDYQTGDDKVNTAIEGGVAPDVIMEGPERLVANWGAKGLMVDMADMLDDTDLKELSADLLSSCYSPDGALYEYPLVANAFCMAINKTTFEAAGAMQYLNEETHTWNSVADFMAAIDAVHAYTGKQVGAVFCGGQGGDQGTRELVKNLCSGNLTDAAHTKYTWDDPKNIEALKMLYDCEGIEFDPSIVGGDEIALFYNGTLDVVFCWNVGQQQNPNNANTGAEKTANGDDILFMAFPSDTTVRLGVGEWGFGIFNNGDESRIAAAKQFVKFFCDSAATADAVKAANYFAVRTSAEGTDLSDIWSDNPIMNEYNKIMSLAGDYYQVTTGWAEARTAWWNMLQQVGASDGSVEAITAAVQQYVNQANGQ